MRTCRTLIIQFIDRYEGCYIGDLRIHCRMFADDYSLEQVNADINDLINGGEIVQKGLEFYRGI